MKLCYRGAGYDHTPPVLEVTESELLGQYRGRPCHFTYVRHIPCPQPVAMMKFRGHAYRTTPSGGIEPLPPISAPTPSPLSQARRHLLEEATRVHQENIRRSLARRLEVAQAQGNQQLLTQLEREQRLFA